MTDLSRAPQPTCFVIMPYGRVFDKTYETVIKPAIRELELRPVRADQINQPGVIMNQIWKSIEECVVCVADVTNRNANVMYELGLAHAAFKPVVQFAQNTEDLPFDLRSLRHFLYRPGKPGRPAFKQKLQEMLREAISDPGTALVLPSHETVESVKGARQIAGQWLENIVRNQEKHYSIVNFRYNQSSRPVPFMMDGYSFRWNARQHSDWNTEYIRIKRDGPGFEVEYIYSATIPGQDPKRGYGISRFKPAGGAELVQGTGYYLAGEEPKPNRRRYRLQRINEDFKLQVGAPNTPLTSRESMEDFVRRAHAYYATMQRRRARRAGE